MTGFEDVEKIVDASDAVMHELLDWLKERTARMGMSEQERFVFSAGVCLSLGASIAGIHDRVLGVKRRDHVVLVKKIYKLTLEAGS